MFDVSKHPVFMLLSAACAGPLVFRVKLRWLYVKYLRMVAFVCGWTGVKPGDVWPPHMSGGLPHGRRYLTSPMTVAVPVSRPNSISNADFHRDYSEYNYAAELQLSKCAVMQMHSWELVSFVPANRCAFLLLPSFLGNKNTACASYDDERRRRAARVR